MAVGLWSGDVKDGNGYILLEKCLFRPEEDNNKAAPPLLSLYFLVPQQDTRVLQSWDGSQPLPGSGWRLSLATSENENLPAQCNVASTQMLTSSLLGSRFSLLTKPWDTVIVFLKGSSFSKTQMPKIELSSWLLQTLFVDFVLKVFKMIILFLSIHKWITARP